MEEQGKTLNKYSKTGGVIVSETYGEPPETAAWKRRKHVASAGETTFFDIEITQEIRLKGGEYKITNFQDVHEDDYIEFSVIDKDDVLGLFSTYGLTVGVDILELSKFIRTEYIDEQNSFYESISAFEVCQGLYLRIAYNSYGQTNINFMSRILWYE